MKCPTCHAEVEGSPKFCPVCGSKIEAQAGPSAQPGATQAAGAPPATEATLDPFIGQMVGGRYKITKLLGEGGMGSVYLGEQTIGGTARKVAIKTLHPHLSKDPKILARFERECETVVQLQHPNTIQLYDFGKTDDGILYMVMEFVQGKSLASVLEEKKSLEPSRVEYILQQICDALGEAHGMGIVHRDMKPDNIVLTERAKDWVKVLDFGIAKRSEAADKEEQKLTQQGTVLGTPPYMSPEQFTGKPIDARSDIYSIGVIAYEMLAGKLPFSANTPWEWATQHMTVMPTPITTTPSGAAIPQRMTSAVMKALEKDPANRFATTKDFYEAFSGGVKLDVAKEAAPAQPKGKTEIGTPLQLPASGYGPSGPASPQAGYPPPAPGVAPAYTPASGNVAFPTPAGIPQPPPRSSGGGKGGMMVALLGVLGLLFAGVIVYGVMHGRSSEQPLDLGLDAASAGPDETTLTTATTQSATPPPALDTSIPTLTPVKPPPPVHHPEHPDGGGTKPPPPPPPPATDPKECQIARQMLASGKDKEIPAVFASLKSACFNQHGHL